MINEIDTNFENYNKSSWLLLGVVGALYKNRL